MSSIAKIIFSLIIFSNIILCKTLPENFHISTDNQLLIISGNSDKSLYSLDTVKTIYLNFEQSNWYHILGNNFKTKTDLVGTLTFDGVTYNGVGVRFRGETSYMMTQFSQKKSFNISIDYIDSNQRIDGYKTLNLNNCFQDPSFMREVLYYYLINEYIPAPKANFVKLVINGENWGLYSNVQQLNKKYYSEWFVDNTGTSWRAKFPDTSTAKQPGQPNFGAGYCSLNYLGDNPLTYTRYYTLKSTTKENPWEDLVKGCYYLHYLPIELMYDSLQYYLNVDRCLWHIACENVFTDEDGYINKGGSDYYVYYDDVDKRINPIEYDGNSTFLTNKINQSIFFRENDKNYPLVNRLLANPALRQRYVAHVKTIINNSLTEEKVNPIIDKFKNLIEQEVVQDKKKLYSYQQFLNSINELKNFIKNRRAFILNVPMITAQAPVISNVKLLSSKGTNLPPTYDEEAIIQAKVESQSGIHSVYLYYGTGLSGPFRKVRMFDDGLNNDEKPNDGIFAASIPPYPAGTYIRYYIEALSNNDFKTASYSPEKAEHNVYLYLVENKIEQNSDVVINELMADNTKTIADPQGQYDDWIELFNRGTKDVDLSGMYLTDKIDNLKKWKFPNNTTIKAGEYLIIWADENSKDTPGLHTNFKLSADGEVLLLINSDAKGNTILDSVSFGRQKKDISYGRYPNGFGNFYFMNPTPGAYNDNFLSIDYSNSYDNDNKIEIYPNPADRDVYIKIKSNGTGICNIRIYNFLGQLIHCASIPANSIDTMNYTWNRRDFSGNLVATGTYIISSELMGKIISKILVIE